MGIEELLHDPVVSTAFMLLSIGFIALVWFWRGSKVKETPGEGCFIATAAFGSPMALELISLRRFRDEFLLRGALGSAFVWAYYRLSPPIANLIRDNEFPCRFVRSLIRPVAKICALLTKKAELRTQKIYNDF